MPYLVFPPPSHTQLKKDTYKKVTSIAILILEIFITFMVFFYPMLTDLNKGKALNYILWSALFLYLMRYEYGAFSKIFNSQNKLSFLSEICYETYIFQFFAITVIEKYFSFLPIIFQILFILILSFVIGKIVHEIVKVIFKMLISKKV